MELESPTGSRKPESSRPPEPGLRCPRCDSSNTKFCYYNNYSLNQPRHFCKTCRRYWTRGGALRNVPIGGGCRKSKKSKSSAASRSSSSSAAAAAPLDFLHGLSPATEVQLNGLPFSRLHGCTTGQFFSFGDLSSSSSPTPAAVSRASPLHHSTANTAPLPGFGQGIQEMEGVADHNSSVASSIESLSCLNQDLHWRLQQQRLAVLYGGGGGNGWFFGNSYSGMNSSVATIAPTATASAPTATAQANSNWSEIQAWNDLQHQFSALP